MRSRKNPTTANEHAPNLPEPLLRWMADSLYLGGLCGRTECRRARICRGDPRACLSRYAPLVPGDAREAMLAMISGLIRGLDFDTMSAGREHQIEALGEWLQLVERGHSGKNPRGKASAA